MDAESIRKVTAAGIRRAAAAKRAEEHSAAKVRKAQVTAYRKEAARELPLILKHIKAAARMGCNVYHERIGDEGLETNTKSDYFYDKLTKKGFQVTCPSEHHHPHSDESYTPYTDVTLVVRW